MKHFIPVLAGLSLCTGPAHAAMVSFLPTEAVWQNAILTNGGVATYTTFNATTAQISWGIPIGTQQSSYLISANVFDPVEITPPAPSPQFQFANFTHNNFPISLNGPALQYVELKIAGDVRVDGNLIGTKTFYFDFYHDETRNNLMPCPYGGANNQGVNINGCADAVADLFNYDSEMFNVGGTDYYLDPEEFRINGADAVIFYTKENAANHAQLIGRFVPVGALPAAVPEPASWLLMVAGFGLLGATLRARRQAVQFA